MFKKLLYHVRILLIRLQAEALKFNITVMSKFIVSARSALLFSADEVPSFICSIDQHIEKLAYCFYFSPFICCFPQAISEYSSEYTNHGFTIFCSAIYNQLILCIVCDGVLHSKLCAINWIYHNRTLSKLKKCLQDYEQKSAVKVFFFS